MKLGRIVGRVVTTKKLKCMEGVRLVLLQPVNRGLEERGDPLVAVDVLSASEGDIVYYDGSREAGQVLADWYNPLDAAVMGIVDDLDAGEPRP